MGIPLQSVPSCSRRHVWSSLPSSHASSVCPLLLRRFHIEQSPATFAVPVQPVDEQSFQSKCVLTNRQKARAVSLEPAFEHLLREVGVDEVIIWALPHAKINDCETFTGLVQAASEMKEISADLWIGVSTGSLPKLPQRGSAQRCKLMSRSKQKHCENNTVHASRCFLRSGQVSWSSSRPSTGTT